MNIERAAQLSEIIADHCLMAHGTRSQWRGDFGQWLTYKFIKEIGMARAYMLAQTIEHAYRNGKPIEKTALNFFITKMRIAKNAQTNIIPARRASINSIASEL